MVAKKTKAPKAKATKTTAVAVAKKDNGKLEIKKENQALADMYSADLSDDFSQDDLVIARVLLGQSQSKYVQAEKAKAGQLVGSREHDVLADKGEKLEIIPFHRYKSFRLFKPQPGGGTPTFIEEVPYNHETITWEKKRLRNIDWTYKNMDGKEVTENLNVFINWNYFAMLADQVTGLPRVISFASTSYMAGRDLGTFALEAQKQGYPLPFKTYMIGSELVTNDKGSFYKFIVEKGRDTTDEELSHIAYWAELAKAGDVRVDEAADEEVGTPSTDAPEVEKGVQDADADY